VGGGGIKKLNKGGTTPPYVYFWRSGSELGETFSGAKKKSKIFRMKSLNDNKKRQWKTLKNKIRHGDPRAQHHALARRHFFQKRGVSEDSGRKRSH